MKEIIVNGHHHIEAEKVIDQNLLKVTSSPLSKSETRFVNAIDLKLSDVNEKFVKTIVTLVDTPGSDDT